METAIIKSILYRKAGGIQAVARAIGENKVALSQVINYARPTARIREKLTVTFGIRFNDALLRTPSEAHKHTKAARAGRNKKVTKKVRRSK